MGSRRQKIHQKGAHRGLALRLLPQKPSPKEQLLERKRSQGLGQLTSARGRYYRGTRLTDTRSQRRKPLLTREQAYREEGGYLARSPGRNEVRGASLTYPIAGEPESSGGFINHLF